MRFGWLVLVPALGGLAACSTPGERASQEQLAETYMELGVGYLEEGEYDRAYRNLQRSLEHNRRLAGTHNALGLVYQQKDRPEDAEHHFRRAIRYDAEDPQTRNNYGIFLCRQGQYEAADEQFLAAVDNPMYSVPELAYLNAGLCARRAGWDDKAEAYFARALDRDARLPRALYEMADLQFQQGETLRARAFLQRYEAVTRPNPLALWLGIRIERANGDEEAVRRYEERLRSEFPEAYEELVKQ